MAVSITVAALTAQLHAQAVVQAERFVVTETPLVADAAGTSQVRTPDIAPLAVRSLSSIADNVANLHVNSSGAGSFGALISMRGLANTPYFSDPSVAVYFDDLPLGSTFTYPVDLLGFSNVTVSRGPQPAASGRAAEGGLIVFSSMLPDAAAAGTIRAGIGNFNARTAAVEFRSARGEHADASLSAAYSQRDGYIENTPLGTRVDDQQISSAAARVRVRPTATTEATLQVLVNQHRDGAQPLVPIGGPLFTVARGREGNTDSDFAGAALKLAFDTALGRLSATTSRTRWTLDPYDNRLVLPPPLDSHLTQTQSAWNEDVRLASDPHAATPWHVGAWFSDTRTDGDVNRSIPGLFPIEGSSFVLTSREAAAFGEITVPTASGWQFTGAVRAEQIKKDFDRSQTVPAPGRFSANDTMAALLPKGTATYALRDNTHFSASIGFGVRPGGWSAYTDKPYLAGFDPEKATTFEVGADTVLPANNLRLAVRGFDYEIRDYQIERSFNATDYLVVNAPRARSVGGEFEAAWHPVAAWTFTATVGLTNTTLREFIDPFTGISYAGHRAPYTPSYDAHVSAAYHMTENWFAAADVTAIGRTYYDESEASAFASPAHVTGNAQFGYNARCWSVTLHVENLADVRYTALIIPGVGHEVPGAPRTYGVEVSAKW